MIQMLDGTLKPIQEIIRGDMVAPGHKVARLCETMTEVLSIIDVLIFKINSMGHGLPNRELTITCNHPIIYNKVKK